MATNSPAARMLKSLARRKPARAASPIVRALFAAIDASGLTYTSIEARSGVNRVTVSRWKSGAASPRWAEMEYVAEVLGYRLALVPLSRDENNSAGQNPDTDAK